MLTAAEQFQLELINRARLDPLGEVARNPDVSDLNQGLAPGTLSAAPRQPLAPNAALAEAARGHGEWMLEANVFSHDGEGGSSIRDRIEASDYIENFGLTGGAWGENLSWTGVWGVPINLNGVIGSQHNSLFLSPPHRFTMMVGDFREIGIAQVRGDFTQGGQTYDTSMVVNKFATTGNAVFLTGVAYADADADGFYSIGEGTAGVTFAAQGLSTDTAAAGGYALALTKAANVTVTVSYGDATMQARVDLSDLNVKLDLVDGVRLLSSGDLTLLAGASEAQLLGVADLRLTGNDAGNLLIGNAGANVITGGAGNDVLAGGRGDDVLDGGGGWNMAVFSGNRAQYTVVEGAGSVTVTDTRAGTVNEGVNTLTNIQVLRFADQDLRLAPAPAAENDAVAALQDGPAATGNVLANDSGVGLSVVAVAGADVGAPVAGTLGTLTLQADGSFSYVADAARHLAAGATAEDAFTYTVVDPGGASVEATLVVTVTGVNDPASIEGTASGSVTEGDPTLATGVLLVTDPDAGESRFQAPDPAALQTAWGSFAFDPLTGEWSFAIDNDAEAVRALDLGETATAELHVTSFDGTASETIAVTVTGSGRPLPETVTLSGTILGRGGAEMVGATVTFTPHEGDAFGTASGAGGAFSLALPAGLAGGLSAEMAWVAGTAPITTGHALQALRLAVGLGPSWGAATAMDFIAADLNGDGAVTAADALGILRFAVGLGGDHAPRWVFLDAGADLSTVGRDHVSYETGVTLAGLDADHGIELTALLIGQVQSFA